MSLPEPLSATGAAALEAIVRSPSNTLVATDLDGTLAPIVEDPEQAYADPNAVTALGRLAEHVGPIVLTGRPVRTAVRLGGFPQVPGLGSMIVLGQYGVEPRDVAADEYQLPPSPPQITRAIIGKTEAQQVIFAGDDLGDLPAFQAVRELAATGVVGLPVCSASIEEDARTDLSDVIVDGPSALLEAGDRRGSDSR